MSTTVSTEPGIDKYILFEKVGYKPHPGQMLVHESEAQYRIPCCGRRWGKSQVAGHELSAYMFKPDTRWWIVGPTYALAEKEFRVVYDDIFRKLGNHSLISRCKKSYNVKQGDMRIEMPWNTILEAKSAEKKDGLVGEGLDGVCLSEAALHSPDTWNMYLQPALTDKDGWAIFPSTPRGYNWYHGLWRLGQESELTNYESWRFPSWDNPHVYGQGRNDPKLTEIEQHVSEYHFQQEYGALFTAFEGKIYNEFDATVHVKDIKYNPLWKNFWAFDYGFSAPFVCLDIMVDPADNVYVWREYQVRYKSTYEHGLALRARPQPVGFHVDGRVGDPRGADESATLAMLLGGIVARPIPWIQGIESVKRWLKLQGDGRPKLFIDSSCTELLRQIEQLRTPNERENHNAKEGQHDYDDHGPDALRYFFSEYFVMGMGSSLSDVYSKRMVASDSFFTYHSNFKIEGNGIIPFG